MNDAPLKFPLKITRPKNDDEAFEVYVPDLDETIYADSFAESFAQARDLLEEHLAAGDLPEPSQVLPFSREGQYVGFVMLNQTVVD